MPHSIFSITVIKLSLHLTMKSTTKYTIYNHPPSITKQVPISIESRLSSLSSNEKTFNESAPINQEVLKKSRYDFKLKYQKIPQQQDQNNSVKEK